MVMQESLGTRLVGKLRTGTQHHSAGEVWVSLMTSKTIFCTASIPIDLPRAEKQICEENAETTRLECYEHKQLSAFPQTSGALTRNARKHLALNPGSPFQILSRSFGETKPICCKTKSGMESLGLRLGSTYLCTFIVNDRWFKHELDHCKHLFHFKCVKLRKHVPETWYCMHCK